MRQLSLLRQALVASLLLPLACDAPPTETPIEIQRIILISIDTLRADALGAYGQSPSPTPNIDSLAAQGVLFENPIAPSPITLPSHTTLLTGLHPLEHGILVNSQAALDEEIVTLADRLKEAGWKTGAIISSAILHHRYGLTSGFDEYRDNYFTDMVTSGDDPFDLINARVTTREALDWLRANMNAEHLFLFIHYIDPHSPYEPGPRFAKAFPDDPYLGEVAFVDHQIGRLFEFMKKHGLLEGTLWVVTSDHGEGLGQHGAETHGVFLYDEIVRVPLILSGAGIPRGESVSETVGLIDVAPTLIDLVGLPSDESLPGYPILGDLPADRSLVSTSYIPSFTFGWSPLWSLSTGQEKFILAPEKEYYETGSDPGELENLAATRTQRAEELEQILRANAALHMEKMREPEQVGIGSAGMAQLAALGYVLSPDTAPERELDVFVGRDPKEMRAVMHLMNEFNTAITLGDFESARELLVQVVSLDPQNIALDGMNSQLMLKEGRYQELLDWQETRPPDFKESAMERYRRALALRHTGRTEEAIEVLQETKREVPSHVASRYELALLLSLEGRDEQSMEEYESVLELDPRNEGTLLNYANLLSKAGRTEEAASKLEALISYKTRMSLAHRNLGLIYGKLGRHEEALRQLEHYLAMEADIKDRAHIESIVAVLRQIPRSPASEPEPQ